MAGTCEPAVISKKRAAFSCSSGCGHNRARWPKPAKSCSGKKTKNIRRTSVRQLASYLLPWAWARLDDEEIMVLRELKKWIHVGRLAA